MDFQFEMNLDKKILDDFASKNPSGLLFKTVDDILSICKIFFKDVLEEERRFFESVSVSDAKLQYLPVFYRDLDANFRLGWGSGMVGAMALLLPANLALEIRDLFFESNPINDFPKSKRATVKDNSPGTSLGWVKLSMER